MQTFVITYYDKHDREVSEIKMRFRNGMQALMWAAHHYPVNAEDVVVLKYSPELPLFTNWSEPLPKTVQFHHLPEFLHKKDMVYRKDTGTWTILRDFRPKKRQSVFFGGTLI